MGQASPGRGLCYVERVENLLQARQTTRNAMRQELKIVGESMPFSRACVQPQIELSITWSFWRGASIGRSDFPWLLHWVCGFFVKRSGCV